MHYSYIQYWGWNYCCIHSIVCCYMWLIAIIPGSEQRNLDRVLTDDDLQEVYEAVYEARDKWFNMGMALKLKVGSLNAIKAGSGDVDENCLNMLQEWLHNGTNKTWRAIAEALGSKTVARIDLKVQILS